MAKENLQETDIYDITHRRVVSALREILSDPDFGLSLKPSVIQKLKKSVRSKKEGRVKDLNKIFKKYGV